MKIISGTGIESSFSTIAAISTPVGAGAIGIIRISGNKAREIIAQIFSQQNLKPRYFYRGFLINPNNQKIIDDACVVYFKAPYSYTGEDVIEIQVHSSIFILKEVLAFCLESGARLADKGEFTRRAFINGKLTLPQAESVIELINAKSSKAHGNALNQLQGKLLETITQIKTDLTTALEELEAVLDFPEEVDSFAKEDFTLVLKEHLATVENIIARQEYGQLITGGIKCLIVGKPNVGKSQLMNRLAGEDRAIVSDIAGTTRDFLSISLELNGVAFEFIDTAGIRKTDNPLELLGIAKVQQLLTQAQVVLWLVDGSKPYTKDDLEAFEQIADKDHLYLLLNKEDLGLNLAVDALQKQIDRKITVMAISALDGYGLEDLKKQLYEDFFQGYETDNAIICNVRQITCLRTLALDLSNLLNFLNDGIMDDVVAYHLHHAIEQLGEISGETVSEEVLDGIFERFCIGK